jgi:hypothetical protein
LSNPPTAVPDAISAAVQDAVSAAAPDAVSAAVRVATPITIAAVIPATDAGSWSGVHSMHEIAATDTNPDWSNGSANRPSPTSNKPDYFQW